MSESAPGSSRSSYDRDFQVWSVTQAAALRKLRPAGIDWENLAEEIEALAKKDRRSLKSHSRVLLAHLLKLAYWGSGRSENERIWRSSVRNARQEIQDILADSPSLRAFIEHEYADCYAKASADVADLAGVELPKVPPWGLDVVLADDFFGAPETGSDPDSSGSLNP